MTTPVTWQEISAALGTGEARIAAEEHWRVLCPPEWHPGFNDALNYCRSDLVHCLARAELYHLRRGLGAGCVWAQDLRDAAVAAANRIRGVREKLEKEVYG